MGIKETKVVHPHEVNLEITVSFISNHVLCHKTILFIEYILYNPFILGKNNYVSPIVYNALLDMLIDIYTGIN